MDFTGTTVTVVIGGVSQTVAVAADGSFSVSVPAGTTGFAVKVDTLNDDTYEGNEQYSLTAGTSGTPAVTGTATITDEADLPKVSGVAGDSVAEGSANTFTVTLSNASTSATTVNLTLAGGTAEKGVDFTGTTVTVVIGGVSQTVAVAADGSFSVSVPAGTTGFAVKVDTLNDDTYEGNEQYSLTAGTSGTPAVTGTATITDEADLPKVSGVAGDSVAEGSANTFTVTLSNASTSATTVNLTLAGGTAEKGVDFTGTTVTVVIGGVSQTVAVAADGSFSVSVPAGTTGFAVKVDTLNDDTYEGNEQYSLTAGTSGTPAVTGTATITDEADLPKVSGVAGDSVAEGSANTFTVTLSNASTSATTVNLTLAGGTAEKGVDFTGTTVTVVIGGVSQTVAVAADGSFSVSVPAGTTGFAVKVDTLNDDTYEGNEQYSLTAGTSGTPAVTGTATITDEADLPKVSGVAGDSVAEGSANTFTVTLSNASTSATTVNLTLAGGTAEKGVDFTGTTVTVVIGGVSQTVAVAADGSFSVSVPAGTTGFAVKVDTLNDDTYEGNEQYSLTAGTSGTPAVTGTATITDEADLPKVSGVAGDSVAEGSANTFTVTLSNASTSATTVNLTLAGGTAEKGVDFTGTTVTVVIGGVSQTVAVAADGSFSVSVPAGTTGFAVKVDTLNDDTYEGNEQYSLTAGTSGTPAVTGTATITDEADLPKVSGVAGDSVAEGSANTFTVTLSNASTSATTVNLTLAGGTAEKGVDFTGTTVTVVIGGVSQTVAVAADGSFSVSVPAGTTGFAVKVDTLNDDTYEGNEQYSLTAGTSGTPAVTGTATITDEADLPKVSGVAGDSVAEGSANTFTVTLSNASTSATTVNLTLAGGTAEKGVDFTGTTVTVVIGGVSQTVAVAADGSFSVSVPAGTTGFAVKVDTLNDDTYEGNEQYSLTAGTSGTPAVTGTATITDEADLPKVSGVAGDSVAEGSANTFTVTLSNASTSATTVNLTLAGGTAEKGVDFTGTTVTVVIGGVSQTVAVAADGSFSVSVPAGTTGFAVKVDTLNDDTYEGNEQYSLTAGTSGTPAVTGTATITDEADLPKVSGVAGDSVAEGSANTFTVTLSNASTSATTVNLTLAGGTAEKGVDFTGTTVTVVIGGVSQTVAVAADGSFSVSVPAGTTGFAVKVDTLNDDTYEGNEQYSLTAGTSGTPAVTGTATITDEADLPKVSGVAGDSVAEGSANTFTVTLSNASTSATTVNLTLAGGTAEKGVDFTGTTVTVVIGGVSQTVAVAADGSFSVSVPAGTTGFAVKVDTLNDDTYEGNEQYSLTAGTSGTPAVTGTATITDEADLPKVSGVAGDSVAEGSANTFTVTLSNASTSATTVNLTLAGGTAEKGVDFTGTTVTVVIGGVSQTVAVAADGSFSVSVPAGTTGFAVKVDTLNDDTYEGNEQYSLTAGTSGTPAVTGTATITDEADLPKVSGVAGDSVAEGSANTFTVTLSNASTSATTVNLTLAGGTAEKGVDFTGTTVTVVIGGVSQTVAVAADGSFSVSVPAGTTGFAVKVDTLNDDTYEGNEQYSLTAGTSGTPAVTGTATITDEADLPKVSGVAGDSVAEGSANTFTVTLSNASTSATTVNLTLAGGTAEKGVDFTGTTVTVVIGGVSQTVAVAADGSFSVSVPAGTTGFAVKVDTLNDDTYEGNEQYSLTAGTSGTPAVTGTATITDEADLPKVSGVAGDSVAEGSANTFTVTLSNASTSATTVNLTLAGGTAEKGVDFTGTTVTVVIGGVSQTVAVAADGSFSVSVPAGTTGFAVKVDTLNDDTYEGNEQYSLTAGTSGTPAVTGTATITDEADLPKVSGVAGDSVAEGSANTFTVTLSNASTSATTVNLTLAGGTAEKGVDFTGTTVTVVIGGVSQTVAVAADGSFSVSVPAGTTGFAVKVDTLNDDTYEGNEQYSLTAGTSGTPAVTGTATITDEADLPKVSGVAGDSVAEGSANTFTVTLSNASTSATTVNLTLAGGTAEKGVDFTGTTVTVVIGGVSQTVAVAADGSFSVSVPAGTTGFAVKVDTLNDDTYEGNEQYSLTAGTSGTPAVTGTATITDEADLPKVSGVAGDSVAEGSANTFTVTLSNASTSATTVNLTLAGGTAEKGVDFTGTTVTVVIGGVSQTVAVAADGSFSVSVPAGTTGFAVKVDTLNDDTYEGNEQYSLTAGTSGTPAVTGTATITDEADLPKVSGVAGDSVAEGSANTFTVTLSNASTSATTVNLTLAGGTAEKGVDFTGTTVTVVIGGVSQTVAVAADGSFSVSVPAGTTGFAVKVDTLNDDTYEGNEQYSLTAGTSGTPAVTGTATITDEADLPKVSGVAGDSVAEGSANTFTVTLSNASTSATTVNLTLAGGTAEKGVDFTGTTVTVVIGGVSQTVAVAADGSFSVSVPAGTTGFAVKVDTLNDDTYEGNEQYSLTAGTSGTPAVTGTATITDEADLPKVSGVAGDSVAEGSANTFTVTLSNASTSATTVNLTLAGGTAEKGVDFTGTTVTVVIGGVSQTVAVAADGSFSVSVPAGTTGFAVKVDTLNDDTYEGNEQYSLTAGTSGTPAVTGTATITDEADLPKVSGVAGDSVAEGSANTFTVTLSNASTSATTVNLTLAGGTAEKGVDFTGTTVTVVIGGVSQTVAVAADGSFSVSVPAGTTGFAVKVDTLNDDTYEGNEQYSLTAGTSGTPAVTGTATITDEADLPKVSGVAGDSVAEGSANTFTVTLSNASTSATTVNLTLAGGTAEKGVDFTGTTVTVVIGGVSQTVAVAADGSFSVSVPAGTTGFAVKVDTLNDDTYEGNEQYSLTAGTSGTPAVTGTATITDEADLPKVSGVAGDSVAEGSANTFTVTLSNASTSATTVNLTLAGGTAEKGVDFTGTTVTVVIGGVSQTVAVAADGSFSVSVPAGTTGFAVKVDTLNDDTYEGNEQYSLTAGTSGTPAVTGTATITDEADLPKVSGVAGDSVAEGSANTFTVTLSNASTSATTVNLTLAGGTAEKGVDFTGTTVTVVIGGVSQTVAVAADGSFSVSVPAGTTGFAVKVDTLNDDTYEGNEQYSLTAGTSGTPAVTGTATITDEADLPKVSGVAGDSVAEGSANTFTVTLSNASTSATTVNLTLAGGTAEKGVDFTGTTVTVVIGGVSQTVAVAADGSFSVSVPAGTTGFAVKVDTLNDDTYEGNEQYSLTAGTSGTPAVTGTATITDEADLPKVSGVAGDSVAEGSANTFTVTLSNASTSATTVNLTLAGGTAEKGVDFTGTTVTVVIGGVSQTVAVAADGSFSVSVPAGTTGFAVKVDTLNDDTYEGNEQYSLTAGTSGTPAVTGTATITDEADLPKVSGVAGDSVAEGSANTFTVTLSNASTSATTVNLTLAGGTAEKGVDFTGTTVTVVIGGVSQTVAVAADGSFSVSVPAGTTGFAVKVDTLNDDTYEGNEQYSLTAGTSGTPAVTGTATITDEADLPKVSGVAGDSVAEGSANTFTVTLSNASTSATTVNLTLAGGTAEKGVDFTGTTVTVVIGGVSQTVAVAADGSFSVSVPAGTTGFAVKVDTLNDDTYEGNEQYSLTAGTSGTPAVTGTATITDEADLPKVSGVAGDSVAEGSANTFTVTLSNASTSATTVNLTLAGGTAEKGVDFTGTTVTVVIGGVSQTVAVAADGSFSVSVPAGTRLCGQGRYPQ
ncbi:hypothetical protein WP9W18E04_08670 [Aeromonas veronii]|nr:hypothetical protein WP9W18E04_08670 [Aeromonas veronii]